MRCSLGWAFAACLVAQSASGQCPDGSAPPCARSASAAARRTPPPPDIRARRFVLLPFRNVSRAPQQEWLTTGAPLMLGELLAQYRDLTVVPEERVVAARRRLGYSTDALLDERQLRALADETDGWTVVTGNVIASGNRLRFSAQATDIATSRVLARADAVTPLDGDVQAAFDTLRVKLLEAVGVKGSASDAAAMSTKSVDAYRAYVRGMGELHRSAYRKAQSAFAEAVRLDSTFALAWAKLALVSISASVQDLINPANPLANAISRAADNAGRLPPREAALIRSMQAFFFGQPGRAMRIADSLVAADRDNLDAREWLASLGTMAPVMDTAARPPRLVMPVSRIVALARETLERDPGRHYVYGIPSMLYLIGTGLWNSAIVGTIGEGGSLLSLIMQAFAQRNFFLPVLRDTLFAMPLSDFGRLPPAEQAMLRRRMTETGAQWVERWLAVGPDEADAHLWASRFAEASGDYARSLRENIIAESLGVQSNLENLKGRRIRLLTLLGQYAPASLRADSIPFADQFWATGPPSPGNVDNGRVYAYLATIAAKRWQRMAEIVEATPGRDARCLNLTTDIGRIGQGGRAAAVVAMDTAAKYFATLATMPSMEPCVGNFAGTLVSDATTVRRTFGAAALRAVGDSLRHEGQTALGYRAMRTAWNADTSSAARGLLLANPWFMERSRAIAIGSHFTPVSAEVSGDSAVFALRATTRAPFELSIPKLPTRWSFFVTIPADSVSFRLTLRHEWQRTNPPMTGSLPELVAALGTRQFATPPSADAGAANAVTANATTDGFRIVLRGPAVATLKRLAPRTAEFSTDPCIAVTEGLCANPSVSISYR